MSYLSHHPLPTQNGAIFIDNSFLETFTSCPRKAEYKSFLKRVTKGEKAALSFGSAIHLALDYRYAKHGGDLDNPADLAICEGNQQKLLQDFFAENPAPEGDHRDLNFAIEIVQQYNRRYTLEPFNVLEKDGKPLVECSFALPFAAYDTETHTIRRIDVLKEIDYAASLGFKPEIPIIYTGKIDLPALFDGTDLLVVDHKTGSTLGDSYWARHRVAPQFYGYVWAWWKSTGVRPKGFMVNAIRTKSKPIKAPRANSWDAWWEECFQRDKEYIDEQHLQEWEFNTLATIEELMWHHRRGYFPMRRQACTQYGKCEFYDVCYSRFESRRELVEGSMFADNNWSPLVEHKTKFDSLNK